MSSIPGTAGVRRSALLPRLHARPLLWKMMLRQGIDPAESWWHGTKGLMDRVLNRCLGCQQTAECRSWLGRAPLGTAPPEFCRNRNTLTACRNLERALTADGGPNRKHGGEPSLPDLTADPIMWQLMAADGVEPYHLQHVIDNARELCRKSPAA